MMSSKRSSPPAWRIWAGTPPSLSSVPGAGLTIAPPCPTSSGRLSTSPSITCTCGACWVVTSAAAALARGLGTLMIGGWVTRCRGGVAAPGDGGAVTSCDQVARFSTDAALGDWDAVTAGDQIDHHFPPDEGHAGC